MESINQYGKPCMTNLPTELGRAIFQQILNTPKPDDAKMLEEARRLEQQMIKARKLENAHRNAAK